MDPLPPRLEREFKTIEKMIELYCRKHHGTTAATGICSDCDDLLRYAHKRLEYCPFHEEKPACLKCPIHCYAPKRRAHAKEVMRFAGPRMLLHHPVLAILHQLDNYRPIPPIPPRRRKAGGGDTESDQGTSPLENKSDH